MSGRRYGRPGSGSLLGMMAVNALLGGIVLFVILHLFGIREIVAPDAMGLALSRIKWNALWPLVPGIGVAFGCLWYWLVVIARSRRLPWAGACIYGSIIAVMNVLLSGLFIGLLHGNPLLYFLIGLVNSLLLPTVVCAMVAFGLAMGILNGLLAQSWVDRQRSSS